MDFIKEFWDGNADTYKCSSAVSWKDEYLLKLEYDVVSEQLFENKLILDVGCANGHATLKHAKKYEKSKFVGIDFSDRMIYYAQKNKNQESVNNISFEVGDITNIKYDNNSFDIVYTTRVLINLPSWDLQLKGLQECLRVVKPGGKVIILEGFYEPFIKLNSLRSVSNLSPLEEHDFNRYIKKYKLENFLNENKYKFRNIDFSSVYYVGSRLLRELVTDYKSYEGYTNPILEEFYNLEKRYSGGGFGIQQAYIIYKGE